MLLDADQQRHDVVGEDTCDLFEAIERSFDVELGYYSDLAGIRVSELAEKINSLASYPTREKCLSAVAFYRLRHAFETVSAVPVRSILPTTPVRDVLPWSTRRTRWKQLEEATGLTFPRLAAPAWLFWSCLLLPASLLIFAKRFEALSVDWVPLLALSFGLFVL